MASIIAHIGLGRPWTVLRSHLGLSWGMLWGYPGPSWGAIRRHFGAVWECRRLSWGVLEPSCAILGLSWFIFRHLETILSHLLGPSLERSCRHLEPSWVILGPSRIILSGYRGPSWGGVLEVSWAIWGAILGHLGALLSHPGPTRILGSSRSTRSKDSYGALTGPREPNFRAKNMKKRIVF